MKLWFRRGDTAKDSRKEEAAVPECPKDPIPVHSPAVQGIDDVQRVVDEFETMKATISRLKQDLDSTLKNLRDLQNEYRRLQADHNRLLEGAANAYRTTDFLLMQSLVAAKGAADGLLKLLQQEGVEVVIPKVGESPKGTNWVIKGHEPNANVAPGLVTSVLMPGIVCKQSKTLLPPLVLVSSGASNQREAGSASVEGQKGDAAGETPSAGRDAKAEAA